MYKTPTDVLIANKLRQQLRDERIRQGLTQAELARRAGVVYQTISTFENGSRDGQLSVLLRIAVALGMSVEVKHV